jgi:DNA-nicking Smr family endonuclease
MEGRSRKRFLSEEELELWTHVTRQDEPLARARPHDAPATSVAAATPNAKLPAPTPSDNPGAFSPTAGQAAPARNKPAAPPPPARFDPKLSKRIARGRREIEARLDLHGLRQQDAYAALRRFLANCQAAGHRHVLIITGKGGSSEDTADRDYWNAGQRGVLRRLVPNWLSEPAFRLLVVSFTESSLKHGGSGALYVTVRKAHRQPKA